MTLKALPLLALGAALLSVSAEASREDVRQHRQRTRLREGVRSGELTRPEAAHARHDQRKIQRLENKLERARAEGNTEKVDRLEKKMEKAQNRASRRLSKNKHDDDSRPRADGHRPGDDHPGQEHSAGDDNSGPATQTPATPPSSAGQ
jgi:hypothetical protein